MISSKINPIFGWSGFVKRVFLNFGNKWRLRSMAAFSSIFRNGGHWHGYFISNCTQFGLYLRSPWKNNTFVSEGGFPFLLYSSKSHDVKRLGKHITHIRVIPLSLFGEKRIGLAGRLAGRQAGRPAGRQTGLILHSGWSYSLAYWLGPWISHLLLLLLLPHSFLSCAPLPVFFFFFLCSAARNIIRNFFSFCRRKARLL